MPCGAHGLANLNVRTVKTNGANLMCNYCFVSI